MKKSIFDLHLNSVENAVNRISLIKHCKMVAWLSNHFRKIKFGEITFKDYENETHCLGIETFSEESFEVFKAQNYI